MLKIVAVFSLAQAVLKAFAMLDALDARQHSLLRACLLGTALGDALARHAAGAVSVGTEQSALVLASLLESEGDLERTRLRFRRHLLDFCVRVPLDVSLATLRTCLNILLGRRETSVACTNHEAALRSAVIGACLPYDAARRRGAARTLARVTHRDARAVEAAVFSAELGALCARSPEHERATLVLQAARASQHAELREVVEGAVQLALFKDDAPELANESDDVLETLRACVWAFVRHGDAPVTGIRAATSLGGASDAAASIVGSWLGILHGEAALPQALLDGLDETAPFAPASLRALGGCVSVLPAPRYSRTWALARNLRSLWAWAQARMVPPALKTWRARSLS